MSQNARIAKQLVKIAKILAAIDEKHAGTEKECVGMVDLGRGKLI